MQVLQSHVCPLARPHQELQGPRDVPCRAGVPHQAHPRGHSSTGHPSPPPTQTGPGTAKQSIQPSLNPSAGKDVGLRGEKGRKWGYLEAPVLRGMAKKFCSLPQCQAWGHSGCPLIRGGPTSREQSRGCCCKQDFGPQGAVPAFGTKRATLGPKQTLWPPQGAQEAMSGGDHGTAKLMNIPFLLLIFPKPV